MELNRPDSALLSDYGHSPPNICKGGPNVFREESSPTSVTTISMGVNGAEVTLDYHQPKNPSDDRLAYIRESALLDEDLSPARTLCRPDISTEDSPQRISFCGLRTCSDVRDIDTTASTSQLFTYTESRIASILSSAVNTDEICGGWQSFYSAWHTEDIADNNAKIKAKPQKHHHDKFVHRKTFNLSARKERLASLRQKLYPFQEEEEEDIIMLRKTRSFSVTKNDTNSLNQTPTKKKGFLASLGCTLNENYQNQSPAIRRYKHFTEDYESDPEDFTKSRQTRPCAKRVSSGAKNNIPNKCERSIHHARWAVQKFLNEKHTFVFHDTTRKRSQVVQVWIERGQLLDSQMIAPKLVWFNKCRRSQKNRNHLQRKNKLSSVELLDIQRIVDVPSIDRELFPFAKTQSCVMVKTQESTLIFETASRAEKEYFATSLKLSVSRLATLLIVSDAQMVEEFFNDFDTRIGNEDKIFTSPAFS